MIRTIDLLDVVPRRYRHLFEIKFVLGLPTPAELGQGESIIGAELGEREPETSTRTEGDAESVRVRGKQRGTARQAVREEQEIQEESRRYGDIVRLEGLEGGENMDHGKSVEWLRWVGRREREGSWVIKCDDDVSDLSV